MNNFLSFEISGCLGGEYEDGRAFWDIAPYSPVGIEWRFRGAFCLHHQGDE
jgi:hypothetical protein